MTLRMYGLWHQQFECQTCFDQSESNLGLSVTCFFSIHEISTSEMCEECRLTQKCDAVIGRGWSRCCQMCLQ